MSSKQSRPAQKPRDVNASPASPTPSPRRTPSASATPAAPRGPLPFSAETSYHKRLRSLLLEHRRCRKEWQELVIRGLVGRCRAAYELWTDIEIGLKYVDDGKAGTNQRQTAVRAGYLFAQSRKLSDQVTTIHDVLASLGELLATMTQLADSSEELVVEASKVRGTPFAFRDPMWVTWPLSRFSDGLLDLTSHYRASLSLMHSLIETLLAFPSLPSENAPSPTDTISQALERDKKQKGPPPEEIQAAMSLLAVQPLLPGKGGEGAEAWEEIMTIEVGGW